MYNINESMSEAQAMDGDKSFVVIIGMSIARVRKIDFFVR